MIDTDKYKGHDTGWKAHFFEDGSIAIGGVCKLLTEETRHKTRKMIEANALLIADAPLLLEEVKRLRGLLEHIQSDMGWTVQVWQNENYMGRQDWMEQICEIYADLAKGVEAQYHGDEEE